MNRRLFLGTMATALAWSGSGSAAGLALSESVTAPRASTKPRRRFLHEQSPLVMTADSVRDAIGAYSLAKLPNPEPKCRVRLRGDVTLAYYKDRNGKLMLNRSGYATAFAVIFGIVEGDAAKAAYAGFPTPDNGIPLFFPFIADTDGSEWHNHASWPFCDTFFLWGKSIAEGQDYTDYNAALLARSVGTAIKPKKAKVDQAEADAFGSFHEYITLPDGLISGSGRQLWSAAAYLNVCIRAGLVG